MTARKKKISVKKILNKAFVLSVIVCLCISQTAIFAKADVVEFTEATKLGATAVELYGLANNSSMAYENLTESGALAQVTQLYDTYMSNASDPVTLATIGAALAAAGAIAVIYDAVTGQGYIQYYQETYINSLDGYWDYTLNDLGLERNTDGRYEYTIVDDEIQPIVAYIAKSFYNSKLPYIDDGTLQIYSAIYNGSTETLTATTSSRYDVYSAIIHEPSNYYGIYIANGQAQVKQYINGNQYSSSSLSSTSSTLPNYYYLQGYGVHPAYFTTTNNVPVYNSLNECLASLADYLDAPTPPAEILIKNTTNNSIITFPDPDSETYIPSPFRFNTNIEWNPDWGNPLPDGVTEPEYGVPYPVTDPAMLNEAVPEMYRRLYVDTVEETNPETNPETDPEQTGDLTTTTLPLLPITLPNFNFSFSGIWHYVVDWVASLGSWFTAMFQMWNTLPYAMVLPVYATAVVVIVIGVYKRFFM